MMYICNTSKYTNYKKTKGEKHICIYKYNDTYIYIIANIQVYTYDN